MTKYIELEALKNRFAKRLVWLKKDIHDEYSLGLHDGCEYDTKLIDEIPTADVAPVRHGRWVDKPLIKSFKHTNIPVVECSACGIDFCDIINNHYFMYKYCPNCGAKMDGGNQNV